LPLRAGFAFVVSPVTACFVVLVFILLGPQLFPSAEALCALRFGQWSAVWERRACGSLTNARRRAAAQETGAACASRRANLLLHKGIQGWRGGEARCSGRDRAMSPSGDLTTFKRAYG